MRNHREIQNIRKKITNNNLEIEYTQTLTEDNIKKKKVKTDDQNESENSCSSRYSNT